MTEARPAGGVDRGLLGRADELRAIDAVLDAARRGSSGVLVLAGEAGMGKLRVLREASTSSA